MATPEPIFDVAQLAHVELLTPDRERTLWFFKDLPDSDKALASFWLG